MKSVFLLLLFSMLITKSKAGREEDIKQMVQSWNTLHNGNNGNDFINVFAPEVYFYGRSISREQCCKLKTKLLKAGFQQEIISDIAIAFYSSGTVTCSFSKRTKAKNKIKEHWTYLMLKQIDGQYRITVESDRLLNENESLTLNLGKEESNKSKSMKIPLVIFGILLLGVLWWYYGRDTGVKPVPEKSNEYLYTQQSSNKHSFISNSDEAKIKGNAFENFIVKKFDTSHFKLIEWRSDKYHEGIYAASNHLPDMEWKLNHPMSVPGTFAVECKYRSGMINGYLEIAKDYQLNNYRTYQRDKKIPVFIVLGLGGTASQPAELYIIPLNNLQTGKVYSYLLQQFVKKKVDGTFFYNASAKELS